MFKFKLWTKSQEKEVSMMSISSENQTISITLPKDIIKMLDEIALKDDRSRGYIAAKIIKDNIEKYLTNITKQK
jgi:metal-responsive CopG/Arc/MetJ family transcriptional regulator